MKPSPVSPYGVEKIAGEQYLHAFSSIYGLETVSLRYFNVFGPRQDPSSAYSGVISIFADRIRKGSELKIYGDGQQTRDFVFVDNVVDANLLAGTRAGNGISGRAYNVACGKATTLLELASLLGEVSGKTPVIVHAEPRVGDVRESVADISRARAELGYEPKVSVKDGLRELLASLD
jgi:UDP-glucose 4-epimerase